MELRNRNCISTELERVLFLRAENAPGMRSKLTDLITVVRDSKLRMLFVIAMT